MIDEAALRELVPAATGALLRGGVDFAAAEDAVQDALLEALRTWPSRAPDDPRAWLVAVARRRLVDVRRSEAARREREERLAVEPSPGPVEDDDDTLRLLALCAHPSLPAPAAVALTLRAVGGLTTAQIARAYLVPEATMAQRIVRAKRALRDVRLDAPGDVTTVRRVLYLVFNEGHGGDVDLAAEAIRLARQLAAADPAPETLGLLALMLLHHARRPARTDAGGALVPLAEQDRSRWDTARIAEGVGVLQAALARDALGEYQAQAAIAALHADAPRAEETDWAQVVEWYDELLALTGASPVVALNRAVAVGEADGARAGLAALAQVDAGVPRWTAVAAHLRDRAGEPIAAAALYAEAAAQATSTAERDHLLRQAARARAAAAPSAHPPPSRASSTSAPPDPSARRNPARS